MHYPFLGKKPQREVYCDGVHREILFRSRADAELAIGGLLRGLPLPEITRLSFRVEERPVSPKDRIKFFKETKERQRFSIHSYAVWVCFPDSSWEVAGRFNTKGKAEVFAKHYEKANPGIELFVEEE